MNLATPIPLDRLTRDRRVCVPPPPQAFRFTPRKTPPHVSTHTIFDAMQHHASPATHRSAHSTGNSRAAASSAHSASPVPRFKAEDWDKVVARGAPPSNPGSVTGSPVTAAGRAPQLSIAAGGGNGVRGRRLFRESNGEQRAADAREQEEQEAAGQEAAGGTRVEERMVPTMGRPPAMGALSGMHLGSQLMAEVVQVRVLSDLSWETVL